MATAVGSTPWHRGYLLYALCVIGVLMFSIDGSIVAVALPTMMTDLDTTLPLIAWTLAGYTLALRRKRAAEADTPSTVVLEPGR